MPYGFSLENIILQSRNQDMLYSIKLFRKISNIVMIHIDATDKLILKELVKNGKQSMKEISAKVNLSPTPVYDRIKKLENEGIIEKYAAIIDPEKLGFELVVYMQIKLIRHQEELFKQFAEHIMQFEEVVEVVMVSGEYDALMKLYLKDMTEYNDFVLKKISKIDIISHVISSFVLSSISGNIQAIMPR